MHTHQINIYWSNRESVFVTHIPELPGCLAHGDPYDGLSLRLRWTLVTGSMVPRGWAGLFRSPLES